MTYTTDHLRTAGKITVYTAIIGVIVFTLAFVFNLGIKDISHVDAQSSATTTITVLNTPPVWTASTTEEYESSSDNPTNAGDVVSWVGIGTDSNGENYYLLICSASASPTPHSSAAPTCSSGTQWAVSTATISGTQARAATTTVSSWAEVNNWYAWICDGNAGTPRCRNTYTQGTNATNSSPFEVNHRPTFTAFADDSPKEPGQVVTFYSTSSDPDVSGTPDTVYLTVCATAGFSTTTNTCTGTTLATSTLYMSADATSSYTIVIPTQDQDYGAYGYIIDSHGFEASGGSQGTNSTLTVANSAPTVSGALISLAQPVTTDMVLTVEAGQTTGFKLQYTVSDNNSCDAAGGGAADEIVDYALSIYRSGVGSTTCTDAANDYDPNNCYPSGLATSTWNLSCTASTTSCTGSLDTDIVWDCTFPLWYIADPTDGTATSTQYSTENWLSQVSAIDDDAASSVFSESTVGVDVKSFLAFALNTLSIPYGSLEPGEQTDPLSATTTISATGNVGLDKDVTGESMCTTYTTTNHCPDSSTSTISESEQVFATSSVSYAQGTSISSTTPAFIDINVFKSTSTSTPASASAYWGIRVPIAITYAGAYKGENTFTALVSSSSDWGP